MQSLLCKIKEKDETLLAARLQHSRHPQIHATTLDNSFPTCEGVLCKINLEFDFNGLTFFTLKDLAYHQFAMFWLVSGVMRRWLGGEALQATAK